MRYCRIDDVVVPLVAVAVVFVVADSADVALAAVPQVQLSVFKGLQGFSL